MKNNFLPALPWAGAALLCLLASTEASAALGEKISSIDSEERVFAASVRKTAVTNSRYSVEELQTPSGTIRQYVSSSGIIFGIAWDGLTHPDLSQLLGAYFGDYQRKLHTLRADLKKARTSARPPRSVTAATITVRKWGHVRHLQGVAFAPSLIPNGTSVDEIH